MIAWFAGPSEYMGAVWRVKIGKYLPHGPIGEIKTKYWMFLAPSWSRKYEFTECLGR